MQSYRPRLLAAAAALALLPGCIMLVPVPTGRGGGGTGTVESPGATESFGTALNAQRRAAGLAPLSRNTRLTAAAQVHAEDMAAKGYMAHTSPDGVTYTARMRAQGYANCLAGEAIGRAITGSDEALQSWMNSPTHRAILMHPQVREYGVGDSDGYWALLVANPC